MLKQHALAVIALLASVACVNPLTGSVPAPAERPTRGDVVVVPFPDKPLDPAGEGEGEGEGAAGEGEGEGEEGEGEGEEGEGEGEGEEGEGEEEGEGDGVTPPTTTTETRPTASLGGGFFVKNGGVYDNTGAPFVIRGLNHSHAWGHQDNAMRAIASFVDVGANAVRVVFLPNLGGGATAAGRRSIVEAYLAAGLVPIVEDHRTTCSDDPATLGSAVDTWLEPDNLAWLQQYEDRLILNIGNEWMNSSWDGDLWVNEYSAAIARLRAAGVHALLMVDAGGGCGQNPRSIRDRGQEIVDADPEHNVMFDLHLYAYWRSTSVGVGAWNDHGQGSPWNIEAELQGIRDRGLAVVVGELGSDASPQVGYDTRSALEVLLRLDVGFLAWSWNSNSDSALDLSADGMGFRYDSSADLTAGGRLFVEDPVVGLQATAVAPDIFR